MKKRELILPIIIVIVGLLCFVGSQIFLNDKKEDPKKEEKEEKEVIVTDYNSSIIKASYKKANNKNYLISPYSIEVALNLLNEGADGKTSEEIEKAIGKRNIPMLTSNNVKISNAAFLKNQYKDYFEKTFTDNIKNKYNGDLIYDDFTSPNKINDWVNEKTNGMIKKILDEMSDDFVYGVANAVALDLKWEQQFECNDTYSTKFTKIDNSVIDVEMMHKDFSGGNTKYVINDNYKAVSLPYKTEGNYNYEFIGILPTDLNSFLNNIDKDILSNIMKNGITPTYEKELELAIPRFTYEFELKDDNFVDVLADLGIKEAFNPEKANFEKAIKKENLEKMGVPNLYVSTAIHKTYIEFSETGTKAAAVTYFGVDKNSAYIQKENVNITFDKPFIYMIRETNTKEILFFGIVYEPTLWKGTTCSN